ncbi:hypothetical protein GH733_005508 [Mirounga leonina]|nr:hypothetical protein GH733_005508 [Mirounga leonina]
MAVGAGNRAPGAAGGQGVEVAPGTAPGSDAKAAFSPPARRRESLATTRFRRVSRPHAVRKAPATVVLTVYNTLSDWSPVMPLQNLSEKSVVTDNLLKKTPRGSNSICTQERKLVFLSLLP